MTAVQILADDLLNTDNQEVGSGVNSETLTIVIKHSKLIELLQKAKSIEKQQIMDAHLVAGIYSTQQDAEDYYNQTYKP